MVLPIPGGPDIKQALAFGFSVFYPELENKLVKITSKIYWFFLSLNNNSMPIF